MAQSIRSRNPYLVPAITIGIMGAIFLCATGIGVIAFLWAMAQ
jgi:hypothetical protein